MVEEISDFNNQISKGLVFVDFWAPWCGPCKIMEPWFQEASQKFSDFNFFKCNIENNANIAQDYNVRGIPTIILFSEGVEKSRKIGSFESCKKLIDWIESIKNS